MLEKLKFDKNHIDYVLGYDSESNPYYLSLLKFDEIFLHENLEPSRVFFKIVLILEFSDNTSQFIQKPGNPPWEFCNDFKNAFVIADGLVKWDGCEYIHFVDDCEFELEELERLTDIISKSVLKCRKILKLED